MMAAASLTSFSFDSVHQHFTHTNAMNLIASDLCLSSRMVPKRSPSAVHYSVLLKRAEHFDFHYCDGHLSSYR